jgi:hypothetical protein
MVGIGCRAIADDFGERFGTAADRMLQFFNDENAGTFAHDEAITVAVEGTGCTRWRFVEACRTIFNIVLLCPRVDLAASASGNHTAETGRALQRPASVACPRPSGRSWDDEVVPLICPTRQANFGLIENASAANHLATVHGVVFDIFVGARRTGAMATSGRGVGYSGGCSIVGFGQERSKIL